MSTAVLLVRTSPVTPEADRQYNDWYDQVHIPQVLAAVPAITRAQRFRLLSSHGQPDEPALYLALYQIDADDPQEAVSQLGRAMASGEITMSPSVEVHGSAPLYIALDVEPAAESS